MPATDMPLHYAGASRRYLLNSAVITAEGLFRYRLVTAAAAQDWCFAAAAGHMAAGGEWRLESLHKSGMPDLIVNGRRLRMTTSADAAEVTAAFRAAVASTIGYEQTADALSVLLGVPVAVDRRTITMQAGDAALVFRLVLPAGTPRIDPGDKGRLSAAVMAGQYELGLLTRVE